MTPEQIREIGTKPCALCGKDAAWQSARVRYSEWDAELKMKKPVIVEKPVCTPCFWGNPAVVKE